MLIDQNLKRILFQQKPFGAAHLEVSVAQNHGHDLQTCLPVATKRRGKAHSQLALYQFKNYIYIMEIEAL